MLHESLKTQKNLMYSDLICTSISSIEILVFHVMILTICDTHFSAHNTTLIFRDLGWIMYELYKTKIVIFYDTQCFVLIRVSQKGHKDVTECGMTVFRLSWEKMSNFLKFNFVWEEKPSGLAKGELPRATKVFVVDVKE